jgi:hypothetical protein
VVATARSNRRNRQNSVVNSEEIGSEFYEWRRYAGDYRPVVTIQATPEIQLTVGSAFAAGFGATTGLDYRFKTDFGRMELIRDGAVVQPYHPGRVRQVVNQTAAGNSLTDIHTFGAYEYPPEAFRPGAQLILRIWEHEKERSIEKDIPERVVESVWNHFEPYFQAIEAGVVGQD